MENRNLGNYLSVHDNQTTSFNKDIVVSDLEGNQKTVVKCYCTIVSGKTISYNMTVVEQDIFNNNKDLIMTEVDKFKEEAQQLAIKNNVPII